MNGENKNYNGNMQTSRKSRFNVMDAFIILIVLLCIASLVYRYGLIDRIGVNNNLEEYTIQFKIEDISSRSKDALVEGDVITMTDTDEKIGSMEKLTSVTPSIAMYSDKDNPVYYPEDTDNPNNTKYEVNGSISVKGIMTDKGFMLNGKTYIAPNSDLKISTEHIETTIKVIGINAK